MFRVRITILVVVKAVWFIGNMLTNHHKEVLSLRQLMVWMFIASLTVFVGCGGPSSEPSRQFSTSTVNDCPTCTDAKGDLSTTIVSDSRFTDVQTIAIQPDSGGGMPKFFDNHNRQITTEQVTALVKALPKDNKSAITIKVIAPPLVAGQEKTRWEYINQIGCYWFRISWENGRIRGCINKDAWHLGFLVRNNCNKPSTMVLDGHAIVWWENGPQFGLYDSKSGWCKTTRGNFTAIRNTFYSALLAVGVVWWLAYPVADISAGVTVAAFGI